MRREHRPYYLKKLYLGFQRFYVRHFLKQHFNYLGEDFELVKPWHIEVFGDNISVGKCAHIIGTPDKKVRFTTWPDRASAAEITVGDYCLISPGVRISAHDSIRIGNCCMIANNVYISDSDWHGIYNRTRPTRKAAPVVLEDNVWLGDSVIVCKGVTIGENSVIGAGSVVASSIPANVIAAGCPARKIKEIDPEKRMITRQYLFQDQEKYRSNMDRLDRHMLKGNTLLGWFRYLLFPNDRD